MSNLPVTPDDAIVAFNRQAAEEEFVVLINMSTRDYKPIIDVSSVIKRKPNKAFILSDVLTGEKFPVSNNAAEVSINSYTTRLMLLKEVNIYYAKDTVF